MKKPKPLPTHADEIDVLRLHNAVLKAAEASNAALAANAVVGELIAAAERKYRFVHTDGEGIDFNTRAITRKS